MIIHPPLGVYTSFSPRHLVFTAPPFVPGLPRFPRCQLGTAKVEAAKAAKGRRLAPLGLEEAQLDIQPGKESHGMP